MAFIEILKEYWLWFLIPLLVIIIGVVLMFATDWFTAGAIILVVGLFMGFWSMIIVDEDWKIASKRTRQSGQSPDVTSTTRQTRQSSDVTPTVQTAGSQKHNTKLKRK